MKFIQTFNDHQLGHGLSTKWVFTGGEPFLDPGFLILVREIRQLSPTAQINATTNGSLPTDLYQRAAELLDGITISLHLERSQQELQDTIETIAAIRNCHVSVNLMFLPGRLDQVSTILQRLEHHGISAVVRKITPITSLTSDLLPYSQHLPGRKARAALPIQQQIDLKLEWRHRLDLQRQHDLQNYYTQQEERFIEAHGPSTKWKNCGVWYDSGDYAEINTDELIARDQNSFPDWHCYAGIDSIYIDWDGSIYRGMCMNDGAIGHISQSWTPPKAPTVCQRRWCNCVIDIAVRKSKQPGDIRVHGSTS